MSGLAARLHYGQRVWQVDQLAAQVGSVRITAYGEVVPTTRSGVATQFSLSDLSARYLESARKLMPFLHELEAFDSPSLAVRFNRTRAQLLLTASAARQPWGQPLVTGPLAAATTLRIDLPGGLQPVHLFVSARHVDYDGKVVAERVRASLAANVVAGAFTGQAVELRWAAGSVTAGGERLVAPLGRVVLAAWPAVRFEAMTQLDGEFLAATVDAQLQEKSAQVRAEGRVSPDLISRTLSVHTPRRRAVFCLWRPGVVPRRSDVRAGWEVYRRERPRPTPDGSIRTASRSPPRAGSSTSRA
ncbi:MAG: hypothetical protein WDM96_07390 [Lacunisphaera sp.]